MYSLLGTREEYLLVTCDRCIHSWKKPTIEQQTHENTDVEQADSEPEEIKPSPEETPKVKEIEYKNIDTL